jgi:Nif-specific regulatory protein
VAHFIDRYNKENRRALKVTPEAMKVLSSCYWPGNVRELENCIERTATMVQGDTIRDLAFPCKQNRCLTQTLHFLDKADAVAAVAAVDTPMKAAMPSVPLPGPPATDRRTPPTTRSRASARRSALPPSPCRGPCEPASRPKASASG